MKTKFIALFTMLLLGTITLFAQSKTVNFKVYGNCSMCETTIEKAANSVVGVASADWNMKTKIMKLTYDVSKTTVDKVNVAINKVGYDTKLHKASDAAYSKLPGCCQYERRK